jgi:tetratricopeptide (TPR) repeat protein
MVTFCSRLFILFELVSFVEIPAPAGWLRVRTERFDVYSDSGEKSARAALLELDTARVVLAQAGLRLPSTVPRVRVVIFDSAAEFGRYRRSGTTKAFFQSGAERDYIVLGPTAAPELALRHEFVHLVLHRTSVRLPRWLEEGLAEYFSTLETASGKATIGRAVPARVELLLQQRWLSAQELLAVDRNDTIEDDPQRLGVFYAQSWAVVHTLQQATAFRGRLPRFIKLLAEGHSQEGAFQKAFGTPVQGVVDLALHAVREGRFTASSLSLTDSAPAAPSSVAAVNTLQAGLVLADLAQVCGFAAEAGKQYEQLSRQSTDSAEAATGLGLLALQRGDIDAAERLLRRAVTLGSREATTYFELALLLRDYRKDTAGALANLLKAVEMNPGHAEAQYLLGRTLAEAGRADQAVSPLEQATMLLPRQSGFWVELAEVREVLGEREAARQAALRAVEAAATPQESEIARGVLRRIETPTAGQARRAGVVVPPSWKPRAGDASVEGQLVRIDCSGTRLKFYILSGEREVVVATDRPDRIERRGGTAADGEFACGPQARRPMVRVEYLARPDAARQVEGEIVVIEFR